MKPGDDWTPKESGGYTPSWIGIEDCDKQWRDFDRMQGHNRFECKVKVSSIVSFITGLSRRIKKWHMQT